MNDADLEDFRKAIDSYRVTVVVLGLVIVLVCGIFAMVMLISVPHVVTATLEDFYANQDIEIVE